MSAEEDELDGVSTDDDDIGGLSDQDDEYDFGSASDFDASDEELDLDMHFGATCMSESDLDGLMQEGVLKLAEITGLSEGPSRAVLDFLRWKVDDAISLALDDVESLAKKSGLMLDSAGSANLLASGPVTECAVCMDDTPALALPCRHAACSDCWISHIENEVADGNHAITCVGHGCHTVLLNSSIRTTVSDEVFRMHCQNQRQYFMSCSKNFKWCPTPDCGTVIKCDAGGDVVCKNCNEPFCFKCGYDHAPASCAHMKTFKAKNESESKNALWISKNSKECPQCLTLIQKDGGCNWMRCSKCRYEFCWICFKPIMHSEIDAAGGSHKCNTYNGEILVEKGPGGTNRSTEREEQLKLAHYFSRYEAHLNSAKLEEKLLTKHKEEQISSDEGRRMLMDCRATAIHRMKTARNTLCSSYVFAYFKEWDSTNSAKIIFEDLQHLLESRTEALSAAVETSFVSDPDSENLDVGECRAKLLKNVDAVATNQKNLVNVCRGELLQTKEA